jgi:hypothetical protein
MKKILFWVFAVLVLLALILIDHPILMLFNFIIGGVIPGVNVSLGFIPFMIVIIGLLLAVKWSINRTRLQMLKRSAEINKIEAHKKDFAETHSTESAKNNSVIAASPSKQTSTI